jgi:cytochrome b6-f complex iron-sulfur subunit
MAPANQDKNEKENRRDFLAKIAMGSGLLLGYGVFATEAVLFVLPKRTKTPTRKLYAGTLDNYTIGKTQIFYDLEGTPIMVKRDESGLRAFSSVCPHLGCRVNWEDENKRFFCPCHGGVFSEDGKAIKGPPADSNQDLIEVPVHIDDSSGIIYIEVKVSNRRKNT